MFFLLIFAVVSHVNAEGEHPATAMRDLSRAITEVAGSTNGPKVKRPTCNECAVKSPKNSGFNHTLFKNGHMTTPFFIEIAHLNDSLPYLLHLESSKVQNERSGAPDEGLTHGMRYFIGVPLTSNLHLSLESHNLLFTEGFIYRGDLEKYPIEGLRYHIENDVWEDFPGYGRYNLYLHDSEIKNKRSRGQFFLNEYKHIATLRYFLSSKSSKVGDSINGISFSFGLGFHQLDTQDQEGFFNPAAQQNALHNILGWAQSFHNMPSSLRENLESVDATGMIIVLGAGMNERGYTRIGSLPIRYGAEAKVRLEGSSIPDASSLNFRGNLEFLTQDKVGRQGSGVFVILNGGVKLHNQGVFTDFTAGAGYQFEVGKAFGRPSFFRIGYKQSFVVGERHNYQVINLPGERLDNDRIGTFYFRYGF